MLCLQLKLKKIENQFNHDLTNKSSYPQFFVIENIIDEKNRRVSIIFMIEKKEKIL